MAAMFPRVVVWDYDVHHHITLAVRRSQGVVEYRCLDCGDDIDVPLRSLELMKRVIASDDDVQVVAWVDFDGQE